MFISDEKIKELTNELMRKVKECKHLSDILEVNIEHEAGDVKYFIQFMHAEENLADHVKLALGSVYKGDYTKNYNVEYFLDTWELNYFYKMLGTLTKLFKACNEYITENYIEA